MELEEKYRSRTKELILQGYKIRCKPNKDPEAQFKYCRYWVDSKGKKVGIVGSQEDEERLLNCPVEQ